MAKKLKASEKNTSETISEDLKSHETVVSNPEVSTAQVSLNEGKDLVSDSSASGAKEDAGNILEIYQLAALRNSRFPPIWLGFVLATPITVWSLLQLGGDHIHSGSVAVLLGLVPLIYLLYIYSQAVIAAATKTLSSKFMPMQWIFVIAGMTILRFSVANYDNDPLPPGAMQSFIGWWIVCQAIQAFFVAKLAYILSPVEWGRRRYVAAFSVAAILLPSFFMGTYLWYPIQFTVVALLKFLNGRTVSLAPKDAIRSHRHQHVCLSYREFDLERKIEERFSILKRRPLLTAGAIAGCVAIFAWVFWLIGFVDTNLHSFSHPLLQAHQANSTVLYPTTSKLLTAAHGGQGDFLRTLLPLLATFLGFGTLLASFSFFRQPTYLLFTPEGLRFIWTRVWPRAGHLFRWDSLKEIKIDKTGAKGFGSSCISFVAPSEVLKVQLKCIGSAADRDLALKAIQQWGALVPRQPQVTEVLQIPSNHSYTELWLQALTAAPKRERLKPLITGASVKDGAFEVIRPLGVGGQGFAYLCLDVIKNEQIVLKESILPVYVSTVVRKAALEAFENEARILKSLNHEKIVKLRDFFVEDHRAYLVLEFLTGSSLQEIVRNDRPLSEQRVLRLAKQMCEILIHLHGLTPPIVHRDFTPDNLICSAQDDLRLIDFNVAQHEQESTTGNIVGKHAYVPPEQFRGQSRTQSDIYGLGATLYYLLTGIAPEPISASHPAEKMDSVSNRLDEIVARATAVDLRNRYESAQALLRDIEELMQSQPGDCVQPTFNKPSYTSYTEGVTAVERSVEEVNLKTAEPKSSEVSLKNAPQSTFEPVSLRRVFFLKPTAVRKFASLATFVPSIVSPILAILFCVFLAWNGLPMMRPALWTNYTSERHYRNVYQQLSDATGARYERQYHKSLQLATQLIANELSAPASERVSNNVLARIYEQRGWTYLEAGKYQLALADAESALKLQKSTTGFDLKAAAYLKLGRFLRAIESCTDAIAARGIRPKSAEYEDEYFALGIRAKCYVRRGRPNLALADINARNNAKHTDNLEGSRATWKESWDELQICRTKVYQDQLYRGFAFELKQQLSQAIASLRASTMDARQTCGEECRLAEAELNRLYAYRSSLDTSSQYLAETEKAEFWKLRSAVIRLDYSEVIALCTAKIAAEPHRFDSYLDRANAYREINLDDLAERDLRYVVSRDSDNIEAHWSLGELYVKSGNDRLALQEFQALVSLEPRAYFYLRVGQIYFRQDDYLKALASFERAIQLAPDWGLAHSAHGGVLIKLGRCEEAALELHNLKWTDLTASELAQKLDRQARARHALNQLDAEKFNRDLIEAIGIEPVKE